MNSFEVDVNGVNFEMLPVEGGSFIMGATPEQQVEAWDNEFPVRKVMLGSYYLGETVVTQALWQAVMGEHVSSPDLPMTGKSWKDWTLFLGKLEELKGVHFRMPTEAEWENAARGGVSSRSNKYAGSNDLDTVAWYDANSGFRIHPVKQKVPNELGFYDMSGNVWEWCSDWYGDYEKVEDDSMVEDPQGPVEGNKRVIRGSCNTYYSRSCRVSCRYGLEPEGKNYGNVGLRLALDEKEALRLIALLQEESTSGESQPGQGDAMEEEVCQQGEKVSVPTVVKKKSPWAIALASFFAMTTLLFAWLFFFSPSFPQVVVTTIAFSLASFFALTTLLFAWLYHSSSSSSSTTTSSLSREKTEDSKPEKNEEPETPATTQLDDKVFFVKGVSFIMKPVEGGTFMMGCDGNDSIDDERPVHSVTVSSFYMAETEVIQALWEAVMGTTIGQQRDRVGDSRPLCGEGANYPMYYVSWDECQEFIKELNQLTGEDFRLPTEAEWEYAARGGNRSGGAKYAGNTNVEEVAWHFYNCDGQVHPVAIKSPNELGLFDMCGNVWEWCGDWYGDYGDDSQEDPRGPISGSERVLRGGCWGSYAKNCRVSSRSCRDAASRSYYDGFRLCLPQ